MNVSVEASVALPTRLRPTPAQVCDWYEHTLRSAGADVTRVGPQLLEFTLPCTTGPQGRILRGLAGGDLEVTDTADGFEVSLSARPGLWLVYVNLAALGVFGSTLTFSAGPPWYLLALAGVGAAAWGWVGTRVSLGRFLTTTNEAITDSFSAVPPAAPAAGAVGR